MKLLIVFFFFFRKSVLFEYMSDLKADDKNKFKMSRMWRKIFAILIVLIVVKLTAETIFGSIGKNIFFNIFSLITIYFYLKL